MATTPFELNFMVDRKDEKVCDKTLTDQDMVKFREVRPSQNRPDLSHSNLRFGQLVKLLQPVHRTKRLMSSVSKDEAASAVSTPR